MATWDEFVTAAPLISTVFTRRHAATGNLCLLATLRSDGFPRISPVEPHLFSGELVIVGMPGTTKFADLRRDPRFCLHTATVDTHVADGDAKVWGTVRDVADPELHRRFADDLHARTGFDLRGQLPLEPYLVADLTSASAVEVGGGHMDVTIWADGEAERVVRKH